MKIKLNRITLENYKCFRERKTFDFFQKTEISGRNQQGKSTLMNAYMEIITGKEANGSMPDGVRPHDANGEELPKVDVIRELGLKIEGKPTTIRKITKQKWRKPHGQTEEVFDGNVTSFEIDGFAAKQKDYAEFMEKIAKSDILLMCSTASPFLSLLQKSTSEARKFLEKSTGFDLDEFIRSMGLGYAKIAEILKGHSPEDTLKKLRKQLVDQKKKIEAQNTKIAYEKTRWSDVTQVEVSDLEMAKGAWKEKLEALDKEEKSLDEVVKTYDDLSDAIRELKRKADDLKSKSNESLSDQRLEFWKKINEVETQKRVLESDLRNAKFSLERVENEISFNKKMIQKAREKYLECTKREFDETKLREIEEEKFDESSLFCPTCKQSLPVDWQENKMDEFEENKKKRIEQQEMDREAFNAETEAMLDKIIKGGNQANEMLKSACEKKTEIEKQIDKNRMEIQTVSDEIERLNGEFVKLPQEVDLSGNAEYQQILGQIAEKETELSSMNNGSEQRVTIRNQRNEYLSEISKIDSQIQKQIADADEKERRLSELESELRRMSQIAADIEKEIDMVMNFSIQKNAALAEKINPYFHHFQFEFLDYTIEGNPVETCKLMCNGTSYFNGLNGGDKKLCELDLCRGLQDMNGLILPIWVDEANTIDPWRIPQDLEQQIILIQRMDDDLKVKQI